MNSFFEKMIPGPIVIYGYAFLLIMVGYFTVPETHFDILGHALSAFIGSAATYALARVKAEKEE